MLVFFCKIRVEVTRLFNFVLNHRKWQYYYQNKNFIT
jgi:hypothetical protein